MELNPILPAGPTSTARHRAVRRAALVVVVLLAGVSLVACNGARRDAKDATPAPVATSAPTSSTAPTTVTAAASSNDDVESQLDTVSSDLSSAQSDLDDGATQATADSRG